MLFHYKGIQRGSPRQWISITMAISKFRFNKERWVRTYSLSRIKDHISLPMNMNWVVATVCCSSRMLGWGIQLVLFRVSGNHCCDLSFLECFEHLKMESSVPICLHVCNFLSWGEHWLVTVKVHWCETRIIW